MNPQTDRMTATESLAAAEARLKGLMAEVGDNRVFMSALNAAIPQLQNASDLTKVIGAKLEANDCSRLHKFLAAKDTPYFIAADEDWSARLRAMNFHLCQSFVVMHDWAQAFEGAEEFDDGGYPLPYDFCVFEFRMTGSNVLLFVTEQDEERRIYPIIGNGTFWFMGSDKDPFCIEAIRQIRAICIALDAQVAEHDVVRSPTKLNAKRERDGKVPVNDYHVVSLAKRARAKPIASTASTGSRKRLHFRRGHWRHYQAHRTWIKWMLVGDPDLGFIDKEYTL